MSDSSTSHGSYPERRGWTQHRGANALRPLGTGTQETDPHRQRPSGPQLAAILGRRNLSTNQTHGAPLSRGGLAGPDRLLRSQDRRTESAIAGPLSKIAHQDRDDALNGVARQANSKHSVIAPARKLITYIRRYNTKAIPFTGTTHQQSVASTRTGLNARLH
jgi:hypothetical protein